MLDGVFPICISSTSAHVRCSWRTKSDRFMHSTGSGFRLELRGLCFRSVGGGTDAVLRRSDGKGYPASRGLRSVRHFCCSPRPLGRVIAHACVQCNRWMSPDVAASLASERTLHGRTVPEISMACSGLSTGKYPHKMEDKLPILLEKYCKAWVEL